MSDEKKVVTRYFLITLFPASVSVSASTRVNRNWNNDAGSNPVGGSNKFA